MTIGYNGQNYTAEETLITAPELEDKFDQTNDDGFGGDEIEVKYYFQDNGPEEKFYMSSV